MMQVRTLPAIRLWQAVAITAVVLLAVSNVPRTEPAVIETQAAIEAVRQRVEYVATIHPEQPREFLVALAVNSYVVGHVSAPAYGYLNEIEGDAPVGAYSRAELVEATLAAGAGICGNASAVAMEMYDALGVKARQVHAWYSVEDEIGGHVTTEVHYDGAWHWFDPTWGMFYRDPGAVPSDVHSLTETLALDDHEAAAVMNESLLWVQATRMAGREAVIHNGLGFLDMESMRVNVAGGKRLLFDR